MQSLYDKSLKICSDDKDKNKNNDKDKVNKGADVDDIIEKNVRFLKEGKEKFDIIVNNKTLLRTSHTVNEEATDELCDCKYNNNGIEQCSFVSQCKGCSSSSSAKSASTARARDQRQKVIQRVVRMPSSLFTMNLGAFNVYETTIHPNPHMPKLGCLYNNPQTQSDRHYPSRTNLGYLQGRFGKNQINVVSRNTSSKLGSRTSLKPGCLAPGGYGVDQKHGSYARYLARKKGGNALRQQYCVKQPISCAREYTYNDIIHNPSLTKGGKNNKFGVVSSCYKINSNTYKDL